jgi:FMN phosphatase YigB (HAD superfamily)
VAGTRIRTIIFDIGRVLVRVDIRRAQAGLAEGLSLSPEELWTAIEKDPRWMDWQEGRISPRDWHLNLTQRLGVKLDYAKFTEVWNSAIDPQPIHPDEFFQKLAKGFRLGLLSNTDPIHVAKLESTYSFFEYFPKPQRIYSCSLGASKPGPLIYREALKSCKARAEETAYIDDMLENVEAAEKLGLTGFQYRNPEQLRVDLNSVGAQL